MSNPANQTELSIQIAKRRIEALEGLLADKPSKVDRTHYEKMLAETQQVLSRLTISLEQPSQQNPPTADALKQQLERLHTRLQFAEQTLADPETDDHLRNFVAQEHKRLLENSHAIQQELQRLEPGAIWKPHPSEQGNNDFNHELNQALEEVRRLSQLRETLTSWSSRLSADNNQHETARARLQELEQSIEKANALVKNLHHQRENAIKIPETRGAS
jgi:chromosome segregation ATPase